MKRYLCMALVLLAFTSNALAQFQRCTSHTQLLKQLAERYKEVPTAMGIVNDKALMQLYSSRETGSWTIVITNAQGKACIVATGHSFEDFEEKPLEDNL